MEIVGSILMVIGLIIVVVYGIILIVKAFQTSVLWGLAYLFVPFVSLIFIIVHWEVAKKSFLRGLIGIPFLLAGFFMMPEVLNILEEIERGGY